MNTAHRFRRLAATLSPALLAGTGLTVATAPAAHAAASDAVAKLPISSYSALAVDNVHQRVFVADSNVGYYLNSGTIAVYNFEGERLTTLTTNQAHVSGLAVSADGSKLYAGLRDRIETYDTTYTVSYLGDLTHRPATDVTHTVTVGKAPTSIALTAPEEASMSGGIEITGTFTAQGKALPERAVLKVVREDRLGTGTLSSVTVAADGTFTINDVPRTRREVTYTVSWPGDDLHNGSTASAEVYVRR
ncbi:hypothetical protein [Streptomyces coeruleorubidus]|uniref:hypothetical protein n=1 Tax=Streptomyces coeruleorubidus TaxID=116188 RepID=UPI0034057B9A